MKDLILNPTDPSLLASIFLKLDQSTAQTITASPILNWLTASELLATDGSKKLVSLGVATYPSLTELTYLKGVTSAIQTQINAKFTLPAFTSGSVLFSDGSTIAQDNSNFFWDTSTNRLGLGTAVPSGDIGFGGNSARTIIMDRTTVTNGNSLTITAGGAVLGGTNCAGGTIAIKGGTATGNSGSNIEFYTSGGGGSGTADSAPQLRAKINPSGGFLFGSGAGTGFQNSSIMAGIDISYGGSPAGLAVGAENNLTTRTNLTAKSFRMGLAPYNTAQQLIGIFIGFGNSSSNLLSFGGGSSIVQAATQLDFYTASAVNTATGTSRLTINSSGQLVIADTSNFVFNTATGTKFGTATSQKIGFFNATPVVQQGATTDLGTVLSNLGLRAAGTAYPITTSGAVNFTGGVTIATNNLTITDKDVVLGTTTGTKFGTATTQKLGFWNVTPIVQPANTVALDTLLGNLGLRATGGYANFATTVQLRAGTTAANTGPIKFTTQASGLTNVEQGVAELIGNSLQFTQLAKRRGVMMSQSVRTSTTTVENTVTESAALITAEHGANYLEVGKMEELVLVGTIEQRNNAAAVCTFNVKYAGSTVHSLSTAGSHTIAAGTPFRLVVTTTCRSTGASGTMQINSFLTIAGETIIGGSSLPTINTTTAQDTTITAQWGEANASDILKVEQARVQCTETNK